MTDSLNAGSPAPDFDLAATRDQQIRLSDLRGGPVVVYFYPKDSTPGCTSEGEEFRDLYPRFTELGAEIIGISRDSLKSHTNFAAKLELPFPLAADPDETACAAYGVLKEKTNKQGETVLGVVRSTFVIDPDGIIRYAGYGVKAKGHAAEVLELVREIAG